MKIDKAIDIIKGQLYVQNPTIKEALKLVMDAARRQVARPPIFMDTSHLVDEVMYMTGFYICPHCGAYAAGRYCDESECHSRHKNISGHSRRSHSIGGRAEICLCGRRR